MASTDRALHQGYLSPVPVLHAIILGITQGLSEFLPISSSGHLILVPWLFGWDEFTRAPELEKTFDVALHVGTFIAAIFYFRNDLLVLARAGITSIRTRAIETDEQRLAWLVALTSVPGALVGAAFASTIEEHLGAEWLIGVMLVVFGLVLAWADRRSGDRETQSLTVRDALLMGAAQACALQPGVSRSGATISMGRWLGFDRNAAARLSFLMSIPITTGAMLYKGIELFTGDGIPDGFHAAFAWGIVASAVTGFGAVFGLLYYVRTRSFTPFVVYRVLAGLAVVAIASSGAR